LQLYFENKIDHEFILTDQKVVPLTTTRIRQAVDGLFINNVNMADAGRYSCRSVNEAGTAQSSGILTVQGVLSI
jgi:hypothetical protein